MDALSVAHAAMALVSLMRALPYLPYRARRWVPSVTRSTKPGEWPYWSVSAHRRGGFAMWSDPTLGRALGNLMRYYLKKPQKSGPYFTNDGFQGETLALECGHYAQGWPWQEPPGALVGPDDEPAWFCIECRAAVPVMWDTTGYGREWGEYPNEHPSEAISVYARWIKA